MVDHLPRKYILIQTPGPSPQKNKIRGLDLHPTVISIYLIAADLYLETSRLYSFLKKQKETRH